MTERKKQPSPSQPPPVSQSQDTLFPATSEPASSSSRSTPASPSLLPFDGEDDDLFWNEFATYDVFDLSGGPLVEKAVERVRNARKEVENILASHNDKYKLSKEKTKDIEARLRKRFQGLKKHVEVRSKDITGKLQEAPMVRLRDRICFLLGVTGMVMTAMIMAGWPQYYPLAYTVKIIVLIGTRFIVYRKKQWHYFLFDMCYFVNLLLLIYLYILPSSRTMFIILWGLSHGPLAWAILTWRNSLVFHSFDKVTSVAVHFEPPMTLFTLRWFHADPAFVGIRSYDIGTYDILLYSLMAYLFWQLWYYVFVEVGRAQKIRNGGRVTSYTFLLADTKSPIHKLITLFGKESSLVAFMTMQLIYTIVTVLPVRLFYLNIYAHGLFLCGIFSISVWNGANFYFSGYFARVNLENLRSELRDLRDVVDAGNTGERVEKADSGEKGEKLKEEILKQEIALK